jgi:hypothetical protein
VRWNDAHQNQARRRQVDLRWLFTVFEVDGGSVSVWVSSAKNRDGSLNVNWHRQGSIAVALAVPVTRGVRAGRWRLTTDIGAEHLDDGRLIRSGISGQTLKRVDTAKPDVDLIGAELAKLLDGLSEAVCDLALFRNPRLLIGEPDAGERSHRDPDGADPGRHLANSRPNPRRE